MFRICSRPEGTIEIFVAEGLKRFHLAKADPRLGHERRYSGVPPGTRASCASGPAGDKSPGYCHMSLRDEEPKVECFSLKNLLVC
jgi:hypothetical protein